MFDIGFFLFLTALFFSSEIEDYMRARTEYYKTKTKNLTGSKNDETK